MANFVKLIPIIGVAVLALSTIGQAQTTSSTTTPSLPETTDLLPESTTTSGGVDTLTPSVSSQPYYPQIFPEDNIQPDNGTDPAIILGQPAQPNEIPWQAYLFSTTGNTDYGNGCGGSLIRNNWVLSAAHCVTNSDRTLVHMGHINRRNMPYRHYADRRIVHQNYNPNTLHNDVALLRLPVAPQQGANIAIIPMAPSSWTELNNVPVRSSGFGKTRDDGELVDNLNKVNLIGVTNQECANTYGPNAIIASTMCARWSTQSGQSPCNGDSGGPLTAVSNNRHYLVGVASFVLKGNCDSGRPAGFARVTSFRNWVDDTIARTS